MIGPPERGDHAHARRTLACPVRSLPAQRRPLPRPRHRRRQGPLRSQRDPPRPDRQDVLPPGRRGRDRMAPSTRRSGSRPWRHATRWSTKRRWPSIRAMWRELRADRLEAQVLTDLFAAGGLADPAEAAAAKPRPSRRWPPCCATAAASSASTARPCRRSTRCASASCGARRPRWCRAIPSRPEHRQPAPNTGATERCGV